MTKRSSIITPPPIEEPTNDDGTLSLDAARRKEELIKLIRKGAPSVPPEERKDAATDLRTKATFRLPKSLVHRYEEAADKRPVKTPVNTWITEAILEKLKREGY